MSTQRGRELAKKIRRQAGFASADKAGAAAKERGIGGVSSDTIASVESGRRELSAEALRGMTALYGMSESLAQDLRRTLEDEEPVEPAPSPKRKERIRREARLQGEIDTLRKMLSEHLLDHPGTKNRNDEGGPMFTRVRDLKQKSR